MAAILDRDLSTVWLDAALTVARHGKPLAEGRAALTEALAGAPLGDAARKKTVTALTRIWLQPALEGREHTLWALEYSDRTTDWRPLHVGQLLAGEPFFRDLLAACTYELRARGQLDTVTLRARLRNTHGTKRSIDIATQRGVKTLRSLGLLTGDPQDSISGLGALTIQDGQLAAWLVRCLLLGRGAESIAVEDLSHAPELFAVQLPAALPRAAAGLTKHVEGIGRTVLALDR
jgi:hypothetical protein